MAFILSLFITMFEFVRSNHMNQFVIFEPTSQLPISSNGVTFSVMKSAGFAFVENYYWRITHFDNIGFQLHLLLNNSWSFHPSHITNIKIEIQTNSFQSDFILSFSQLHETYISTMIDGKSSYDHLIYPQCQTSPNKSPVADGDVAANVDVSDGNTIQQKAMNDTQFYLLPHTSSIKSISPLTFILRNDPLTDTLSFTYDDNITVRSCDYDAMVANVPLDIYMATNKLGQTFYVESIAISHWFDDPTLSSSSELTQQPTIAPTLNSTARPTEEPTIAPTDHPSAAPTNVADVTDEPSSHHTNQSVIFEPVSPLPISSNGAILSVLKSSGYTFVENHYWRIISFDRVGFHLHLSLDNSWSFHPSHITNINIEIETHSFNSELLVSFSQLNNTYITTMIDGISPYDHLIYPQCQISSNKSSIAHGNVKANIDVSNGNTKQQKAMNNTQYYLLPNTPSIRPSSPLTFILQNDPLSNTLSLTYDDATTVRTCNYEAMAANVPLDIYLTTNKRNEIFFIDSIAISYWIEGLTTSPTQLQTTQNPTVLPTDQPTVKPTIIEQDIAVMEVISITNNTSSIDNYKTKTNDKESEQFFGFLPSNNWFMFIYGAMIVAMLCICFSCAFIFCRIGARKRRKEDVQTVLSPTDTKATIFQSSREPADDVVVDNDNHHDVDLEIDENETDSMYDPGNIMMENVICVTNDGTNRLREGEETQGDLDENDIEIVLKSSLYEWLNDTVELPVYYSIFAENGFDDLESLMNITMDEMREIGIHLGHREKIKKCIDIMQLVKQRSDQMLNSDHRTSFI